MRITAGIGRLTVLFVLTCAIGVSEARADWLITPFVGTTFASDTTFLDLEQAAGSKTFIYGASGAWLGDQIFGVEAEFSHSPRFFEADNQITAGVLAESTVFTLSGNVIAALPLSVTRESLRPYVTGGVGLLHAGYHDLRGLFDVDSDLFAMNVGGGAIGLVSQRTGVRFDLRFIRSFSRGEDVFTGEPGSKLRFWRATVGVIIRY